LFGSATQAFFLNFSSIVMCFIILNVVLNNLIEKENSEKSFLNLSLICATLYISLPMV
jgi:hypothetical protein